MVSFAKSNETDKPLMESIRKREREREEKRERKRGQERGRWNTDCEIVWECDSVVD